MSDVKETDAGFGQHMSIGDKVLDRSEADAAVTIPHLVLGSAKWRGDHPAFVEGDRRISYTQLAVEMRRAAAGFVHAGLVQGDRVAIWAHNSIDWILACIGVQAAGGVVVPLNTRFKAGEAEYVLNRGRVRFLVHAQKFLGVEYRALLEGLELPTLEHYIAIASEEQPCDDWDKFVAAGAADPAAVAEADRRLAALSGDDVSDILFTSGTTGAPKGVVTTHGQNVPTYREWVRLTTLRADDRYAIIWPFFHCSGYKSGVVSSLIAGSTLYPQSTMDADRLLNLIVAEKITALPGPPTLFQTLLALPQEKRAQLECLRMTVTGATMVAPSLIEAIRDDLGVENIFTGYGLTESCGTVTMTSESDGVSIVVTSPGQAIRGCEMAAMNEDGVLLPPGTEGEIVVRGFNVMVGYFEDPKGTAEAIDAEGWLHTGDVGKVNEDGYLYITGRAKDIYIVGGFNCYPAEIEEMIMRHPAVGDVAVIGVPDERMGEVGKVYIVPSTIGDVPSEAELIGWCRETMANYKVPRSVVFIDSLPRTPAGKVQKFRLEAGEFG
jgi:acyl-CoA synthetase (AMP-forming)/AMP-acid ligase II